MNELRCQSFPDAPSKFPPAHTGRDVRARIHPNSIDRIIERARLIGPIEHLLRNMIVIDPHKRWTKKQVADYFREHYFFHLLLTRAINR